MEIKLLKIHPSHLKPLYPHRSEHPKNPNALSLNLVVPLSTPHTRAIESDRVNRSPGSSLGSFLIVFRISKCSLSLRIQQKSNNEGVNLKRL